MLYCATASRIYKTIALKLLLHRQKINKVANDDSSSEKQDDGFSNISTFESMKHDFNPISAHSSLYYFLISSPSAISNPNITTCIYRVVMALVLPSLTLRFYRFYIGIRASYLTVMNSTHDVSICCNEWLESSNICTAIGKDDDWLRGASSIVPRRSSSFPLAAAPYYHQSCHGYDHYRYYCYYSCSSSLSWSKYNIS
jgi:hypothetical protein